MRLTKDEILTLKLALEKLDPYADLYLFGSRVDDSKQGGDIDLLVISKKLTLDELINVRWVFYDKFGEQKMDLILDDGSLKTAFVKKIFPGAIKL